MALPSFEISINDLGQRSYTKMNGEILPGVKGVTVHAHVGEIPRVVVEFISTDIQVSVNGDQIALAINPATGQDVTVQRDEFRRYISEDAAHA